MVKVDATLGGQVSLVKVDATLAGDISLVKTPVISSEQDIMTNGLDMHSLLVCDTTDVFMQVLQVPRLHHAVPPAEGHVVPPPRPPALECGGDHRAGFPGAGVEQRRRLVLDTEPGMV